MNGSISTALHVSQRTGGTSPVVLQNDGPLKGQPISFSLHPHCLCTSTSETTPPIHMTTRHTPHASTQHHILGTIIMITLVAVLLQARSNRVQVRQAAHLVYSPAAAATPTAHLGIVRIGVEGDPRSDGRWRGNWRSTRRDGEQRAAAAGAALIGTTHNAVDGIDVALELLQRIHITRGLVAIARADEWSSAGKKEGPQKARRSASIVLLQHVSEVLIGRD